MPRKTKKSTRNFVTKHLKKKIETRKTRKVKNERQEKHDIRRGMRLSRDERKQMAKVELEAQAGVDDVDSDEEDDVEGMPLVRTKDSTGTSSKFAGMDFETFMAKMDDSDSDGAGDASSDSGEEEEMDGGAKDAAIAIDAVLEEMGIDASELESAISRAKGDSDSTGAKKKRKKRKKTADSETLKRKAMSEHKNQLASLKDQDPEFFKFLEEHDSELLNFAADMEESGNAAGDASDDEDDGSSSGDDEALLRDAAREVRGSREEREMITITPSMYAGWKKQLLTEGMTTAKIRGFVSAFKSAVMMTLNTQSVGSQDLETAKNTLGGLRFEIESTAVYNMVVLFSLRNMHKLFSGYLRLVSARTDKQSKQKRRVYVHGPRATPSKFAGWSALKSLTKSYIKSLTALVKTITEASVLNVVFVQIEELIPFLGEHPREAKALSRAITAIWSTSEDDDLVLHAFLTLRSIAINLPAFFLNHILKMTYLSYVRVARFTTMHNAGRFALLRNCVVELFGLNTESSYQHAFVYIRQIAIMLRAVLSAQNKASVNSLYNWQIVHSLRVWVQVLAQYSNNKALQPLVYPLAQILIGALSVAPSARYIPIRLMLIDELIRLEASSKALMPAASPLLAMLSSLALTTKTKASTSKPPILDYILRVSKDVVGSRGFKDAVVERIMWLLLSHAHASVDSIAFPELTLGVLSAVRKFKKGRFTTPGQRAMASSLIQVLTNHSQWIDDKRKALNFAPAEQDEVAAFSRSLNLAASPLRKAFARELRKIQAVEAQRAADIAAAKDSANASSGSLAKLAAEAAGDASAGPSLKRKRETEALLKGHVGSDDDDESDDDESDDDESDDDVAPAPKRAKQLTNKASKKNKTRAPKIMEDSLPADTVEAFDDDDW